MSATIVRQLRSETLRVRTLRMTWWLGALGAAYATANACLVALLVGQEALQSGAGGLSTEAAVRSVYGAGLSTYPFVLVMGVMIVTGEFRHHTAATTFLVTPSRATVVLAKSVTSLLVGLAYAAAATVVAAGLGAALLAVQGYGDVIAGTQAVRIALGAFLAASLYGVMGVGIGAVMRNQVAAIVSSLIAFMLVGDLLTSLLPQVGKWLPTGAAQSLAATGTPSSDLLPVWAGALVFLGWAAATAAVGATTTMKRDI